MSRSVAQKGETHLASDFVFRRSCNFQKASSNFAIRLYLVELRPWAIATRLFNSLSAILAQAGTSKISLDKYTISGPKP